MAEDSSKSWWIAGLVAGGCGCVGIIAVAGMFLFGFGMARSVPVGPAAISSDEQTVRLELSIPASARTVSIDANPLVGGTFGREGLRIVAVFELTAAEIASFRAGPATGVGWAPLPLPAPVHGFAQPPVELPAATRGLYFCQTGVWLTGTSYTPNPCTPPPGHFDRYRTAVLDEDTRLLTVVFKNYY